MRKRSGKTRGILKGQVKTDPACVLWGGYASGNTGDELALAVALRDARRKFGDSVCVLSPDPGYTQSLFPDVDVVVYQPQGDEGLRRLARSCIRRCRVPGVFIPKFRAADQSCSWTERVRRCRQLCLVGGGYLTGMFRLDYFLLPVLVAKPCGVPVTSGPLGFGPFGSVAEEAYVAEALRAADLVVRDATSLAFCRQHGLAARLALDDGFRVAEVFPGLSRRGCNGNRLKIGVCIYPQHGDPHWPQTKRWWARLLSALQTSDRVEEVSGFCFHGDRRLDYATTQELLGDGRVLPPAANLRAMVENLCRYDAIVSARYHAVVIANVLGIPNIAVAAGDYYQVKMTAAVRPEDMRSRVVDPSAESPEESVRHLTLTSPQAAGPLAAGSG